MEQQMKSSAVKSIAYTYGMYLGLLAILNTVILYILNEERNTILSIIGFIITVIIYIYGISAYKKMNENYLTIKESLKAGMGMAVIGGIIGSIYILFHYSFIQPEFIDNIRENAMITSIEANPNMTEEQLAMTEKMTNIFTSKFAIVTMYLIASLFFGFLISLIVGLIKKREPHSF
jgi:preprotein translocase subunit YajC